MSLQSQSGVERKIKSPTMHQRKKKWEASWRGISALVRNKTSDECYDYLCFIAGPSHFVASARTVAEALVSMTSCRVQGRSMTLLQ